MKHILQYFVISTITLVALSCSKKETPANETNSFTPMVINAVVDDDVTKTTYTDNGTKYEFSWNQNDYVAVQVYKGGSAAKPDQIKFKAQSDGPTTTLVQAGNTYDLTDAHNVEGYSNKNYTLGDYAFYPRYESSSNNDLLYTRNETGSGDGDSSTDYLKLYESIPYVPDNPSSVIPIIGRKESGDGTPNTIFKFKTATGVLKISLKQIPAGATKLVLTSKNASDQLSGEWLFTDDTYTDGIVMGTGNKNHTNTKTVTFTDLSGLDTYTDFFVPIPVGSIHGIIVDIKKDDNTLLWRVSADADIPINRGVVTELPDIDISGKSIAFTVGGTSNDPAVSITHSGFNRVCLTVTNSAVNTPSSYLDGLFFSGSVNNYKISTWDASHTKLLADKNSGLYYMHYVALSSAVQANTLSGLDDKRVKAYGTVPFYYLSSSDKDAYTGQFAVEGQCSTKSWAVTPTTITFDVSDDPSKGNIMITEFDGLCCDVSNNTHGISGNSTNLYNPANFSSYADGQPVYGVYSGTPGASTNLVFKDVLSQVFYTDQSGSGHIIGCASAQGAPNTDLEMSIGFGVVYRSTNYKFICTRGFMGNYYKSGSTASADYYFYQFGAGAIE